ncbi:MAG TPA: hypothetical protein VFL14_03255 [Xanthomonadales bacterium]|nr:hypothetical protein [Xanthomonadales bacterium]
MEMRVEGGTLMARMVRDDVSRDTLLGLPGLLARTTAAHGCRCVFVDMTALGSPIDPVDRIFLASRLAEVWPAGVRLAALALPEQVNRVIEHMAGNRGVSIRAFTERDEALAWLSLA